MCGRYFFSLEDHPAFYKLKQKIDQLAMFEYAQDEITPSMDALVLLPSFDEYTLDIMKWGISSSSYKDIINARSETLSQRKTFQPLVNNRCLVPCNGFFEWIKLDKGKQKMFIRRDDNPLFYLAGIYNEKKEFVILTKESKGDMRYIHSRTPIILSEDQISSYLEGNIEPCEDSEHIVFEKEELQHKQLNLFETDEEE